MQVQVECLLTSLAVVCGSDNTSTFNIRTNFIKENIINILKFAYFGCPSKKKSLNQKSFLHLHFTKFSNQNATKFPLKFFDTRKVEVVNDVIDFDQI